MEALSDISSDRKSTLKWCSSPRRFGFCTTDRINRRGPYAGKTRKHVVELEVEMVVVVVHHAAVATCHHCTRTFSSNWRLLWTDKAVCQRARSRARTHSLGVDCVHGWKKKCCLSMNERRRLSCAGAHDKIRLACVSTITMALTILEKCYYPPLPPLLPPPQTPTAPTYTGACAKTARCLANNNKP